MYFDRYLFYPLIVTEQSMRNVVSMLLLLLGIAANSADSQWKYLTGYSGGIMSLGAFGDTLFIGTNPGGGLDSAKVYRSADYGLTFSRVDQTLPVDNANGVQCFATVGSNFFAGMTVKGVKRSTDGGRTWQATASFYSLQDAYSLATRGDSLFVGYYNVSWSTNSGSSWTQASFGHPASITMSILPIGNKIFSASTGVSVSTDGGMNWTAFNTGLPNTSSIYYLATLGPYIFVNSPGYGLYRSPISAPNWQRMNHGMAADSLDVRNIVSAPPYLFAGAFTDVYSSRDTGKTWQSTAFPSLLTFGDFGVVGPFLYAGSLYRHAFADFYPTAKVEQVITTTGSYSFNDASNTTGVTLNVTSLTSAALLTVSRFTDPPANPTFVSSPPVNVSNYRWVIDAASGFAGSAEIRISLSAFSTGVVNPADVKIYKRNTSGTGDFTELPTTYDSNTNEIVATVTSFSEFALGSNSDVLEVPSGDPNMPVTTSLAQNFPNPFNPTTQIAFDLAEQSTVRLTVYNVLGEKMATLVDGIESAGHRSASWNASGMASGVYFYKLEAVGTTQRGGSFTQIRKMILLK